MGSVEDSGSGNASSRESEALPGLRVRLLGEFGVWVGDQEVDASAWRLSRARDVVKLLALAPRHRLHRDQVIEALWPGRDPGSAANNLYQVLHAARRALASAGGDGHDCIQFLDGWLVLCPIRGLWVDVDAFEDAAASREPARLQESLRLYRGELLPDDRYADWADLRRDALRQRYRELLAALATRHEERDELGEAIDLLRRLVTDDPVNEPGHRALMRTNARSGDRGAAARQFEELTATLRDELDVDPDEASRALYADILAGRIAPLVTIAERASEAPDVTTSHNLPVSLSSFVGRDRELAELPATVAHGRLVTLVGAGGSGKTRLATELARRCLSAFTDGVWMVELAPVDVPTAVERELVRTLGVREGRGERPVDAAVRHIGEGCMLLVLDNCEHLVDAAAELVQTLLGSCPQLVVLATSREPLRVAGEVVRRVPSMRLPNEAQPPSLEELATYDAVRLFADRASSAHTDFKLSETNAADVVSVCTRLDGLPLALELAAARVPALTVGGIVDRLDDRFRLLTGGARTALSRQQTLAATVEWSYDLLSEAERALFCRLAVFHGRFDLDAAIAVGDGCGVDADDVPVLVGELVERSMAVAENSGETPRFRLLETMREYGTLRLREAGELDAARTEHGRWMLELVERAAVKFTEPSRHCWLTHLESYRDDLRAALDYLLATDPSRGVSMVSLLWPYWLWHGDLVEGHRSIRSALDRVPGPSLDRAEALLGGYALAVRWVGLAQAKRYLDEGIAEAEALGDDRAICRALLFSGIHHQYNDYDEADRMFAAARDRSVRAGLPAEEASAVHARAVVACAQHRFEDSRRLLAVARQGAQRIAVQGGALLMLTLAPMARTLRSGELWLMWEETWAPFQEVSGRSADAYVLANMGNLARAEDRVPQARVHLQDSLAVYESVGDDSGAALAYQRLGQLNLAAAEFDVARRHLERSLEIGERIGDARGVEVAIISLGHLATETGDVVAARELLARAERLCRERSDIPALGMALSRRGVLELLDGNPLAAMRCVREMVDFQIDSGVGLVSAAAWSELADVYAQAGESDRAVAATTEAVTRFERCGYHDEAAQSRRRLTKSQR